MIKSSLFSSIILFVFLNGIKSLFFYVMPMFSSISVRERIKNLISGVYPILPVIYRDGFPSPLSIGFWGWGLCSYMGWAFSDNWKKDNLPKKYIISKKKVKILRKLRNLAWILQKHSSYSDGSVTEYWYCVHEATIFLMFI